jgi:hypothetical protein
VGNRQDATHSGPRSECWARGTGSEELNRAFGWNDRNLRRARRGSSSISARTPTRSVSVSHPILLGTALKGLHYTRDGVTRDTAPDADKPLRMLGLGITRGAEF